MIGLQLHKALKLCPQKNQLGMVLSGAHGITNAISCANIYPIQIIQIIQIIPFLMKNPVFIASFLLVVLTYGISKFGSLNPPK
jgi:vacuolar-type H+-ATPase subunit I/STV1